MKNILKLSLLLAGFIITINTNAQTGTKTPPTTPSTSIKQDTTKKIVPPSTKSTAAKPSPAPTPDAKGGGSGTNKMAINEQGVPKKVVQKAKSSDLSPPQTAPEAPKKKE